MTTKLWKVDRTDDVGWDETATLVLLAKNREEALKRALKARNGEWEEGVARGYTFAVHYLGVAQSRISADALDMSAVSDERYVILRDFKAG